MQVNRYREARDYKYTPFHTGVGFLDAVNGFGSDDFAVIGGGSGTGKSYLAMFIGMNIAKSGKRVLYINAEMFASVFITRMRGLGFDFETDFGKSDKHGHNRFMVVHQEDLKSRITFDMIDGWVASMKPDLLVVDLFGCLLMKDRDLAANTERYAVAYSFYPRTYNCAVIVTEQLMKEYRFSERPDPHNLSNGKALGDKSSKIIMLYNYYSANPIKAYLTESELVEQSLELIVKKDRLDRVKTKIYITNARQGYREITKVEAIQYDTIVFNKGK